MNNKKIVMYSSIIVIVIIIIMIGYYILNNIKHNKINAEYIPEEEIAEEQLRQTAIILYFLDKDSYSLKPETRQIDSKDLINNPYNVIVNLLIDGPKSEKYLKLIPEKTKLISVELKNDTLYLNFSVDFIKEQYLGKEQEELIVKSIVNTVTEFTEINKVCILIEGESNSSFPDKELSFDKIFIRE